MDQEDWYPQSVQDQRRTLPGPLTPLRSVDQLDTSPQTTAVTSMEA